MPIPAIIVGASAIAKTGIGSTVGGFVKGLVGLTGLVGRGGPRDPEAQARKEETAPHLVRLGGVNKNPWARAAPDPGVYYLDRRDGQVYQSKAAGVYPVTTPWAAKRKAEFRGAILALDSSALAPGEMLPAKAGLGLAIYLVAGIVVVTLLMKR